MANTNNSLVRVDIEQLVADLQASLLSSNTPTRTTWSDILADSTGTALLEWIAGNTTFSIFASERSLQEAFPGTARLKSSLFETMRLLGVRLTRKAPASCTVQITKPADGIAYAIPAYSVFASPQGPLFNRSAIIFNTTQITQTATLYKGTVKNISMNGNGTPFQTFVSSDSAFTISDQDVAVTINGSTIPVVTDGLWHYTSTINSSSGVNTQNIPLPAVQDRTTKLGQLELNFGNNSYGTLPTTGQTVQITYATCNGVLDNNSSFTGTLINYGVPNYLTIAATTGLSGGADEQNPLTYQRVGPALFAAFDRAVNADEYNAVAATYPGVLDAQISGQGVVAPTVIHYMNALRTSLLTATPWTATEFANFVTWMSTRSMGNMNFYRVDPVAVPYTISVSIFCNSTSDLPQAQINATDALTTYTALGPGSIGRTIYTSQITEALFNSDTSILYSKLANPLVDLATSFGLTDISAVEVAPGNSVGGTYVTYYMTGISAYSPYASSVSATANVASGESLPIAVSYTVEPSGNTNVKVSWDAVGGYAYIRVYATRGTGQPVGLIDQIPGTQNYFIDTWSVPSTGIVPPQVDSFGIFYPECTSITVVPQVASDKNWSSQ